MKNYKESNLKKKNLNEVKLEFLVPNFFMFEILKILVRYYTSAQIIRYDERIGWILRVLKEYGPKGLKNEINEKLKKDRHKISEKIKLILGLDYKKADLSGLKKQVLQFTIGEEFTGKIDSQTLLKRRKYLETPSIILALNCDELSKIPLKELENNLELLSYYLLSCAINNCELFKVNPLIYSMLYSKLNTILRQDIEKISLNLAASLSRIYFSLKILGEERVILVPKLFWSNFITFVRNNPNDLVVVKKFRIILLEFALLLSLLIISSVIASRLSSSTILRIILTAILTIIEFWGFKDLFFHEFILFGRGIKNNLLKR